MQKIQRYYNNYIKIPSNVVIPEIVTKITGITKEICDTRGHSILDALHIFANEYFQVEMVVSHNLEFDSRVMIVEMMRHKDEDPRWKEIFRHLSMESKKENDFINTNHPPPPRLFCTMKESKYLCNIVIPSKNGGTYLKFPRLIELFHILFVEDSPEGLHNSMMDTLICLRCFIMLQYNSDISMISNSNYNELIGSIVYDTDGGMRNADLLSEKCKCVVKRNPPQKHTYFLRSQNSASNKM